MEGRWRLGALAFAVVVAWMSAGCSPKVPGDALPSAPDRATAPTYSVLFTAPVSPSSPPTVAVVASDTASPAASPAAPPAASPDTAPPDTASPDTALPDTASPDTAPPDVQLPDVALPDVGVPGVNDAGCRSGSRPVVLLHGSFSTVASNYSPMIPVLRASGRCVYGLDYGNGGVASVTSSAVQFTGLVHDVLAGTDSASVDVIAYSQGGLVLRTALRLDGLAGVVTTAVLIAPSWHGTTARLAASVPASLCPACADQVAGSPLLRRLDVGGELDGDVRYAEISTRNDIVVTPVSSQVPVGPADRVRSSVLEDACPSVVTDHIRLPAVRGVIAWTVAALQTQGRPPPGALTC